MKLNFFLGGGVDHPPNFFFFQISLLSELLIWYSDKNCNERPKEENLEI